VRGARCVFHRHHHAWRVVAVQARRRAVTLVVLDCFPLRFFRTESVGGKQQLSDSREKAA
jgi:hypothetical protein